MQGHRHETYLLRMQSVHSAMALALCGVYAAAEAGRNAGSQVFKHQSLGKVGQSSDSFIHALQHCGHGLMQLSGDWLCILQLPHAWLVWAGGQRDEGHLQGSTHCFLCPAGCRHAGQHRP